MEGSFFNSSQQKSKLQSMAHADQQFQNGRKYSSTLLNKNKLQSTCDCCIIGHNLIKYSLGHLQSVSAKKDLCFLEGTAINIIVSNYYNGIIGFVTSGPQAIHGSADTLENSQCNALGRFSATINQNRRSSHTTLLH